MPAGTFWNVTSPSVPVVPPRSTGPCATTFASSIAPPASVTTVKTNVPGLAVADVCALGFGASDTSYGVQRKSGGGACSSLANLHPVIEALSARLDRVSIEHVDWARCVRLYDSAETFFFLDPPYSRCKTKNYAAWQDADMERLRDVLLGIQGSFLLTVNDCPENRRIFTCFRLRGISRQRGIANKTADQRKPYRELIIVPDQALSDRLKAA